MYVGTVEIPSKTFPGGETEAEWTTTVAKAQAQNGKIARVPIFATAYSKAAFL